METIAVRCRKCGAVMNAEPGQTHLVCPGCGAEYVLNKTPEENQIQTICYGSQGPVFHTVLPQGWSIQFFNEEKTISSLSALSIGFTMKDPQGQAMIQFYPFAYFGGSDVKGVLGKVFDYTINQSNWARARHLPDFETYIRERIAECNLGASNIRLERLNEYEDVFQKKAQQFVSEASSRLKLIDMIGEYGAYKVLFDLNGKTYSCLFSTILARRTKEKKPEPEEQPQQASGGFMKQMWDIGKKGGLLNQKEDLKIGKHNLGNVANAMMGMNWGRAFDIILYANPAAADSYRPVFYNFVLNFAYDQNYYSMQQAEYNQAQQIILNAQRQNSQNAFAASQKLMQTQRETSNMIRDGYQKRSATMDSIRVKTSESIRGVNSYTTVYGDKVEAGVQYDHVYQKGNTFVGSENGELHLGPDWTELKRK